MMKKLGIILLTMVFFLSVFSFLPVKKAVCNKPDIALCAAEPWHWEYHPGKGGSGSSGGDNQGTSDPANHSVTKHSTNSSTQTISYQKEHRNIIKQRDQSFGWWLKFLFFWQMFFNK